jgi:hypothetical protein
MFLAREVPSLDAIHEVVRRTESELILFFTLFLVALISFFIPMYRLISKNRGEDRKAEANRQERYMEREKRIIEVVTANTEVMAGLKATLDKDGKTTTASLERIHTRIDEQGGAIAKAQATLDEVVRNQRAISDDIKRGFAGAGQKANE